MKYYLSSYKLGNETAKLKKLAPKNKRTAVITNALDYSTDLDRRRTSDEGNMALLRNIGLKTEIIDLRQYFNKKSKLEKKLSEFGVIWVTGGNCFVLRQAMKLSGFDAIMKKLSKKDNLLYGGFSAGVCVLAPTLEGIDVMDDLTPKPYGTKSKIIWDGLGLIDYSIVPHYKSDHKETELATKAVDYMVEHKILFRALRDGEVIIIE